ncbi:helix-turn-helix domain-containing protein [Weissella cibaria]|uniref:helix-turn-helix domain-containing protein n=1 Tax=Weissella cibaria TaxID=137591 RepID=UPI0022E34BD2|nr:helix-turn-helix transcriptional regulator [Weissella cibaria]
MVDNKEVKRIIGRNLKKLRLSRKETSTELAKVIGVSQSTISDWETGKTAPRSGPLQKLADHYSIPISDFYIVSGDKVKNVVQPTLSPYQLEVAEAVKDVSEDELNKIISYINFLKSQR